MCEEGPCHSWVWWGRVGTQAPDCTRLYSPPCLSVIATDATSHTEHVCQHGESRLPEQGIGSQSPSGLFIGGILQFTDGIAWGCISSYIGIKPTYLRYWRKAELAASIQTNDRCFCGCVCNSVWSLAPRMSLLWGLLPMRSSGLWQQGTLPSFHWGHLLLSQQMRTAVRNPTESTLIQWELECFVLSRITEFKFKASDHVWEQKSYQRCPVS